MIVAPITTTEEEIRAIENLQEMVMEGPYRNPCSIRRISDKVLIVKETAAKNTDHRCFLLYIITPHKAFFYFVSIWSFCIQQRFYCIKM
jgi:hypothetical protein